MDPILALNVLLLCLAGASALVARAAARDARSITREMRLDVHQLQLDLERALAWLRRMEGRQTGGLNKQVARNIQDVALPSRPDGQPDPQRDPDGWRAWARRQAMTMVQRKPDDGRIAGESTDDQQRGALSADEKWHADSPPPAPIGNGDARRRGRPPKVPRPT
jgi:hypothetical protein